MKTLSQLIEELEVIRASHGDLPVYVFEDYSTRARDVNVCLVLSPNKYDDWKFPHVQIIS